jgi:ABC-2 type transport system ATP-binding protein
MSNKAIDISKLNFSYGDSLGVVFNNFNLTILEGERFGLLGPNGAGKTTLMNLMTGVLQPTSGSIKLFGRDYKHDNKEIKRQFGFVPQFHSFYQELSSVENLEFFGAWAGLNAKEIKQRTNELLDVLGLQNVRDKAVAKFSGGMKSRLNIAIGVIHQPKILFLDEPTTGVDVQSRHAIIEYLHKLNEAGTTLVYTSHLLHEAEKLCTKVALIDQGEIVVMNDLKLLLEENAQAGLEGLFINLTGKDYRDS